MEFPDFSRFSRFSSLVDTLTSHHLVPAVLNILYIHMHVSKHMRDGEAQKDSTKEAGNSPVRPVLCNVPLYQPSSGTSGIEYFVYSHACFQTHAGWRGSEGFYKGGREQSRSSRPL
ncbi:hypothetical protein M8J77_004784 [Diaphorina citri]|nr:hypothetical protein M8J77_004784 [Diaphorina citri]